MTHWRNKYSFRPVFSCYLTIGSVYGGERSHDQVWWSTNGATNDLTSWSLFVLHHLRPLLTTRRSCVINIELMEVDALTHSANPDLSHQGFFAGSDLQGLLDNLMATIDNKALDNCWRYLTTKQMLRDFLRGLICRAFWTICWRKLTTKLWTIAGDT